jgi:predicted permease
MPDWKKIVNERLAVRPELAEEFAQHLEDRYRVLLSGGASEDQAYRGALAELSDLRLMKPVLEKTKSRPWDGFWRDVLYAGRGTRKSPIFAVFVVLTLGLGIGANTTVFTLFNTLILNPLPVKDSSSLTAVAMVEAKTTAKARTPLPLSYLNLKDYQDQNGVFTSFAGYTSARPMTLRTGESSERVFCELVTANYFDTLGLKPARGRFFLPEEDNIAATHAVAVMNYATWQVRYGAAEDIVGQTFVINNVPLTIIGVAPPAFIGLNAIFGPNLWVPAAMSERIFPTELHEALSSRRKGIFAGVGRLKPGISRPQAQANLATVAASLARAYPDVNDSYSVLARPIFDVLFSSSSGTTPPVMFAGLLLLAVVGAVLLIACSNVANLLLARAAARQHEIAIRMAMGASRWRLIRQFLTESLFLGLLSGFAGLAIGSAGVTLLWTALPNGTTFIAPKLDPVVFVFTFVVSLVTGFAFGGIPALRASRVGVATALKEEARTAGRSRRRITVGNTLLAGQVAFSFVLLMMAGLFLRSIQHAYAMDPGFQTEHLAVFMTNPGQAGYSHTRTQAFYKEVRDRVSGLPGVESVTWASNLLLWSRVSSGFKVEGWEQRSQADTITAVVNTVDRDYFETAGVALERGRAFTQVDRDSTAPVAIVNAKMANDLWPGQDPIGKRIQLPPEKTMRQIVGIARNANYTTLAESPQSCLYIPMEQHFVDGMNLYVRTKGRPESLITAVQREMRAAGPELLLNDMRTGRQFIDNGLFQAKIGVVLSSLFGLLALGLASIGLYGVMAYSVTQRTRELGVRMALGAARSTVIKLILGQGMVLVLSGVGLGLLASLASGRLLARVLFGVGATDPVSVGAAAGVLIVVALIACYLPARSASKLDPLVALREG